MSSSMSELNIQELMNYGTDRIKFMNEKNARNGSGVHDVIISCIFRIREFELSILVNYFLFRSSSVLYNIVRLNIILFLSIPQFYIFPNTQIVNAPLIIFVYRSHYV